MIRGAAVQVDITPPIGVKMAGYSERKGGCVGIHDPLKAQILILGTSQHTAVFASLDLIGISSEIVNRIRAILADKLQIDKDAILLACTHTHSGPEGFLTTMPIMPEEANPALEEITIDKIVGAVQWAQKLLQPVQLSAGFDQVSGVGLNRNNPVEGTVDNQLSLLRVDDAQGTPLAILYNYGCHPTVMGANNYLISADFPGASRQLLKKIYPNSVIMFFNGGSGDVSTRFSRRESSFSEVNRLGSLVAASVIKALNIAEPCKEEKLAYQSINVDLPIREFLQKEEVEQSISEKKKLLENMKRNNSEAGKIRQVVTTIEGLEVQLALANSFRHQKSVKCEIQGFLVGDFTIFSIPGEPFSKSVIEIKEHFKPSPIMVISYANGYVGYLPEYAPGASGTYEDYVSLYTNEGAQIIKKTIFNRLGNIYG